MLEDNKLWSCAPLGASTLPQGVQVWAARLDLEGEAISRFRSILSSQERARSRRFLFERDRARFMAARGWLRTILSSCLGTEPQRVEFGQGPKGKPRLGGEFARSGLQFNLSHSKNLAVIAVAPRDRVGVDVEQLREVPQLRGLVERAFSPRERDEINKLPAGEQHQAFFRTWTRKEACLKAAGEGIADLPDLTPPLGQDGCHGVTEGPAEAPFHLYDLSPAPEFVGALALAPP